LALLEQVLDFHMMKTASPALPLIKAYRKSASHSKTRRGFGLRLPLSLRDELVSRDTENIELTLEGFPHVLHVRLRRGFWNKCPEFLADEIYDWMISLGLPVPWPHGRPHIFELQRLHTAGFKVCLRGGDA